MCAMLQQQHVLSVSWRIVWCIELGWTPHAIPPPWPASCSRVPTFLTDPTLLVTASCVSPPLHPCAASFYYKHCCIYLFTDVMMLLMLWWRDRRRWLQGVTRDTCLYQTSLYIITLAPLREAGQLEYCVTIHCCCGGGGQWWWRYVTL